MYGRADSSARQAYGLLTSAVIPRRICRTFDSNVSGDRPMANSVQGDANAIGFPI